MRTLNFVSALALTTTLSVPASAGNKTVNDIQRVSTFSATTIAGALAGGPVGMIIGALGGAYLSDQSKKDFEEKAALTQEVTQLEKSLDDKNMAIVSLENRVAKKLEFQVMFPTGEDALSSQDNRRIGSLAKYLKQNPQLKVRLDGHADPRGTDEYNNVLAAERAKSVATALKELGIEENRIAVYSHGSSFAITTHANRDRYAFERRVQIEVFADHDGQVASAD